MFKRTFTVQTGMASLGYFKHTAAAPLNLSPYNLIGLLTQYVTWSNKAADDTETFGRVLLERGAC